MREKLRRNEDTINTIDLKDSIRLYVYISLAFYLIHELHWRSRIFFRVSVHDFTSINMSIRGISHRMLIWSLRIFFLKEIDLFFDFAKIMLFAKLKSCSKRYEKIQTYSLSDSKNFLFLVISSVCLYFQTKKILNVFVKIF